MEVRHSRRNGFEARKRLKAEPPPPRVAELRKMIEEYVADLRAIMDKLREKLN